MGFWENAKGDRDLDRVRRIQEGIVKAQQASDRNEPVRMTSVFVRWRRFSQSWDEAPIVIPTSLLPVACQLAASYQDATAYPVLHVDAATPNEDLGRYVTFKNDESVVIELHTRVHVPEQNQDDRRRAKLRGARNLAAVDPSEIEL